MGDKPDGGLVGRGWGVVGVVEERTAGIVGRRGIEDNLGWDKLGWDKLDEGKRRGTGTE